MKKQREYLPGKDLQEQERIELKNAGRIVSLK